MSVRKIKTKDDKTKWEVRYYLNGRGSKRITRRFSSKIEADAHLEERIFEKKKWSSENSWPQILQWSLIKEIFSLFDHILEQILAQLDDNALINLAKSELDNDILKQRLLDLIGKEYAQIAGSAKLTIRIQGKTGILRSSLLSRRVNPNVATKPPQ